MKSQDHKEHMAKFYAAELTRLVEWATKDGVVLTVTQVPALPLAMGHYRTVVETRPVRELP